MSHKESIAVLGLGFWGTALAQYLSTLGHSVLGWCNQPEVVDSINSNKTNPYCFPETKLEFESTSDLNQVLNYPNLLITLPSRVISEFPQFISLPSTTLLISAMKGFETTSGLTPVSYLLSKNCRATCGVISGPSFAKDVITKTPVAITAAASNLDNAKKISSIFASNSMRLYPSSDLIGVELGGALKNIIAVAVGVAQGLKLGDSTKAALVSRGLAEITRYAVDCGAQPSTLYGLSGLGDLVLTANSTLSRNYSFGTLIGQGIDVQEALKQVGSTAEGYYSALIVTKQAQIRNISMPITDALIELFDKKVKPQDMISKLMSRPVRGE
jgi:glycerol-3-phosphate dehydrogenase (NAD(P)+)